uniref:Receptor ligand binding region domain-containing protein n=1 Tax=Odontella aurita TaxID=265563 RepID=A0A6U6INS6_9STRA|mmetsp:Transcript_53320/g.159670  ORF Transcript_53320/g.159670 Transcript_53320/m.159670 type:complete len:372 (+) Transcript_53320:57-1172(+)
MTFRQMRTTSIAGRLEAAIIAATVTLILPAAAFITLPYAFYDDLRASRDGTVFTPLVGNGENDLTTSHVGRNLHSVSNSISQRPSIALCHVPAFFRWSQKADEGYVDVSSEAYGGAAAALLAMHHFNNGIASIAPALDGIHTKCPIRLTMENIDSQSSGIKAVRELTRMITRSPNDVAMPQPCAVLGSSWSGTTKKMATVTGVYDLLQVTPSASSVALDNMGEYPLFTRTHPSDASMAELSVEYLHRILNVHFFAQLYIDNDFGSTYHTAVVKRAAEYGMVVKSVSFRPGAEMDEIEEALVQLKETGYNYFLGIFFSGDYERIMDKAAEVGVAGEGRFWMFNGALASAFVNGETALNNGKSSQPTSACSVC